MRKLTQKEIDQAPDWATDFIINAINGVTYESKNFYWHKDSGKQNNIKISDHAQPIPRKEFDISEYDLLNARIEKLESMLNRINDNDDYMSQTWFDCGYHKELESLLNKEIK